MSLSPAANPLALILGDSDSGAWNPFRSPSVSLWGEEQECGMKLAIVSTTWLVLAAATAFAWEPPTQIDPRTAQGVTRQTPSFNDETTGPTNPRAPVQSPDWI